MIVPRAYSQTPDLSEKPDLGSRSRSRNTRPRNASRSSSPFRTVPSPTRTKSPSTSEPRSEPVKIPSRTTQKVQQSSPQVTLDINVPSPVGENQAYPRRRESARDLLSATTIPARRRPKGRPSQRLPKGDHVAEFSKLLLDDIRSPPEAGLSKSFGNSHLDALFGNIDGLVEGQMIVGSEGVDESVLTIRSTSSDSLTSLASPEDYSPSGIASSRSSVGKSPPERRYRTVASSEDCASDHPLLTPHVAEDRVWSEFVFSESPSPRTITPSPTQKESRSFKSSLTASLKAIKTAAQSVSSKANFRSSSEDDSYLARSFFDIQPSLTDDRRPPPTANLPSPELRRYLNPYTHTAPPDSPAQLHIWHDDQHYYAHKAQQTSKTKSSRKSLKKGGITSSTNQLPPVVPLATCLPPSVRTAHASSPPIWLSPDGTPSNKQTASPLHMDAKLSLERGKSATRSREPRENSDFLRIFVCEMQMRRSGKLNDDLSAGRARLWLPPINNTPKKPESGASTPTEGKVDEHENPTRVPDRWMALSVDDI